MSREPAISRRARRQPVGSIPRPLPAEVPAARGLGEAEYRGIFEATADGLVIAELDGSIVEINPAACELFGMERGELIGRDVTELMPEVEVDRMRQLRDRVLDHGTARVETAAVRPDGATVTIALRVARYDYRGRPHLLGVLTDVTERRAVEAELMAAKDAAEAASRAKSEFLANMSHEVRTPLNGVIGMTGLLMDTPLTAEQLEFVEAIRGSARALMTVVNDILDFSRVEAGKLALEEVPFDLTSVVQDVVDLLAIHARSRRIDLGMRISADVPRWVVGDPSRVRQVLTNLVGNAVKFTERGGVTVHVTAAPGEGSRVRLSVSDTGIGIAPEQLTEIFGKFTQADASTTRKYGGAGLGLAISKHLVELMGGEIGVTSRLGTGSTFWFELELPRTTPPLTMDTPTDIVPEAADLPPVRALVVEDNAVNQKVAARLLERQGCRVEVAGDGNEALAMLGRMSFDIVFMDCQMPRMDGFQATAAIRKRTPGGLPDPNTPVVAMTAHAVGSARERCLQAGMDDYLAKPVTSDKLRRMLRRWVRRSASR